MKHKLCVQCKYCTISGQRCSSGVWPIDLATNKKTPFLLCDDMRKIGGWCGPDGKYWDRLTKVVEK